MVVCCPLVSLILRCTTRTRIREQRGIDGGQLGDCCVHYFCGALAICQEAQEMNALDKSMAVEQDMQRE
jgi:Cys-rich protein (TIGR01571 family)